jgi:hypothetical protein
MTYLGTIKNGKVELEQGIHLPEGTPVRVEPLISDEDPALGIAEEAVHTGIPDLAKQHDHYIYGTPKR